MVIREASKPCRDSPIRNQPSRLFKKVVQQGRNERRGDAYSVPYVEPLSDVRTPLADFFNGLLRLFDLDDRLTLIRSAIQTGVMR